MKTKKAQKKRKQNPDAQMYRDYQELLNQYAAQQKKSKRVAQLLIRAQRENARKTT